MAERDASRAGFVLVGGHSSRMGRDKALLEFQGSTLVARIAECVRGVTGNVTLIGPPDRYRDLGYTVIADRATGYGPLGGVYTALVSTRAEWNLIVACDMPLVTPEFLEALFRDAESGPSTADCVIPELTVEPELDQQELDREGRLRRLDPLCAVYQRRCATAARRAIDRKVLKMHDFVSTLRLRKHPVADPAPLSNVNTPTEWSSL
jgi:molybdopterin-guanine dinucleotide biosynthesis protein A